MRLKYLERFSYACPSQWRGQLENGRFIYVRYRHNYLQFGIGQTEDDAINYVIEYGRLPGKNEYEGYLGTGEMIRALGLRCKSENIVDKSR